MMENAIRAVKECFPGAKATGRTFPIAKSLQTINEKKMEPEPEPEAQRAGGVKTPNSDSSTKPPHLTLVDLIPQAQKSQLSEDKHMQPCVMKIIHAVKEAVGSELVVMDTHNSSNQFINPVGRPDTSMLAEELIAWTQLVTVGEFKVHDGKDDQDSMLGQEIGRGQVALENQPDRQHFFSFGLNMNALEVVHIHRDSECKWVIESTGLQPFYIGEDSVGFRWLVRLLATEKSKLGFVSPVLPDLSVLEGRRVGKLQLLRRGTGPSTVGSWVFTAESDGYFGKCILKLCDHKLEGDLLRMLTAEGVPHLVKVLASGECTYQGRQWHALLLAPYAQRLTMQLGRKLLVQAARDVADAINGCVEKGVLQRDISLDNIGVFEGRGMLFDFSAAKVVAHEDVDKIQPASPTGKLGAITGTPLYAPLSVLQGRSHTRSSMLEGLYISLLACCCDEKVARRHDMKLSDLEKCAELRAGRMLAAEPSDLKRVPDEFRGFLLELHDLFYPKTPGRTMRDYCMRVTAEQFNGVCSKWAR
ncbi:Putative protein kinase superfamily protein [Klebsormidium nitens]|uniref:Fungal-type protein kinase domain-containing protein n=1 Tax=Klebsormidium nitens TaxID=105231 RepID=A0A1Y1HUJ0_KLENI|nr:Putative protein kinase superfamily protein [Klebsormidium nitens]|eukprot:GAQ79518.1 Putative protein kinase superfamily protein [Klebsormidium nitens]